jgi:nucleoid DNA-binding protein
MAAAREKNRGNVSRRRGAKVGHYGTAALKRKPGAQATVTLKSLAANLSESHEISKKLTEAVLGDLVGLVTKHLKKGERVHLGGLGTLLVRKRAAREPVQIKRTKGILRDLKVIEPKAAPEVVAYEPSARAVALLRGKRIAEEDLKASGGSFDLQNVQNLLGISRQAIEKKVRDNALLAVPGPHGRRRYPVVQFTSSGILPGLDDVLKNLPSTDGWFRLNFLVNEDDRLGGHRPIDLLKEGNVARVTMAAKAVGVQGA